MKAWTTTIVAGILASAASAADTVKFYDVAGEGSTNGGVFEAHTTDYGVFKTFCIEYTEHISYNTTYWYDVNPYAKFGGSGGDDYDSDGDTILDSDTVDDRTKIIYYMYRKDYSALAALTSDAGNANTVANEIQQAIWQIENETGGVANALYNYVSGANLNSLKTTYSGYTNVYAMNVWRHATLRTDTYAAQDQLILIPLPSGAGMAFAGLLGLAAVRRRRG